MKSKYNNLIQQDFRVEHLILYISTPSIEYERKINNMFLGLETLKKRYIETSSKNRRSNYDIYDTLLSLNLSNEDRERVVEMKTQYDIFKKELLCIVNKYNISKEEKYIKKIGMNKRKENYIKGFVNALFEYFNEKEENLYKQNVNNLLILLNKYIEEFQNYDNLISLYKQEKNKDEKSKSVLDKAKSSFNYIKKFVEKN